MFKFRTIRGVSGHVWLRTSYTRMVITLKELEVVVFRGGYLRGLTGSPNAGAY
jgi:hypothetical protein